MMQKALTYISMMWITLKRHHLCSEQLHVELLYYVDILLYFLVCFQDQEIDEETEVLVLASDGLWDVVQNEVRSVFLLSPALLVAFT